MVGTGKAVAVGLVLTATVGLGPGSGVGAGLVTPPDAGGEVTSEVAAGWGVEFAAGTGVGPTRCEQAPKDNRSMNANQTTGLSCILRYPTPQVLGTI